MLAPLQTQNTRKKLSSPITLLKGREFLLLLPWYHPC
jgi:hypothetical protein